MQRLVLILLVVLAIQSPAQAEDEAMEVQRCIWRCMSNSGGAGTSAYEACVADMCSGEPEPTGRKTTKKPAAQTARSAPATPGVWSFGRHPRLGLSAHVTVDHHAFGIACFEPQGDEPNGSTLTIRMTPGIAPMATQPAGAVAVFSEPFGLGGAATYKYDSRGFVYEDGDSCLIDLSRYRAARNIIFLHAEMKSLSFDETGYSMVVVQNGKELRIDKATDLGMVQESVTIPLTGSAAALDSLVANCPRYRAQMDEPCGDG
jgi:hypothetical protein